MAGPLDHADETSSSPRLGPAGPARAKEVYYSERERSDADAVVDEILKAGTKGLAWRADVGAEADVVAMVGRAVSELGGVDILVNNGGIEKHAPLLHMAVDDLDRVLRTNLTGSFLSSEKLGRPWPAPEAG